MLACTCCFLSYCALICCRSGPGGEEAAAGGKHVFASRRYEIQREIVKDEKPLTPPQTQPRSFLAKLVPSFSVLKPVLRPLRPLWAKIRTIRPSPPPPIPLQQTTTLMTRPVQLVQTTAVAPKLMMQQQIKVLRFFKVQASI